MLLSLQIESFNAKINIELGKSKKYSLKLANNSFTNKIFIY